MKEFLLKLPVVTTHLWKLASIVSFALKLWEVKSEEAPHPLSCSSSWLPWKFRFKDKVLCATIFKVSVLFSEYALERHCGYLSSFPWVCLPWRQNLFGVNPWGWHEAGPSPRNSGARAPVWMHIFESFQTQSVFHFILDALVSPCMHLACCLPLIKSSPLDR